MNSSYSDGWQLVLQGQVVDVFYKYTDCSEDEKNCCENIFVKVVNKTDDQVQLAWDYQLGYRADIAGEVTSENTRSVSISLAPKQKLKADCGVFDPYDLVLGIRELESPDVNVLTDILIKNFTETKQ
jgi:hypothetical protein